MTSSVEPADSFSGTNTPSPCAAEAPSDPPRRGIRGFPRALRAGIRDRRPQRRGARTDPGSDALKNGIHILTSVILVVAVGASVKLELWHAIANLGLSSAFGFVYFFGAWLYDGITKRQRLVWVAALTLVWIALTPLAPVGIYLVFPLFFLYLRVMPDTRGVVAVIAATLASILVQVPSGLTFGGVMGPTVSALVTVAIDYAFRALSRVSREREELIEQLISTREELAETQHSAGMVAERQRIAHEIHDTLAQGLSSIQMLLHVAESDIIAMAVPDGEKERPLEKLRLARRTAADNLAEARAMIAALQPASLKDTSLAGALQRIAESFSATGGFPVTLEVKGEGRELPMGVEAALLRIAQGAVSNVVKHAEAESCEIVLHYLSDQVLLDVADDGKGFDPDTLAARPAGLGHIGLDAMKRRAAERGGRVEVESSPGEGTCVSVSFPIESSSVQG